VRVTNTYAGHRHDAQRKESMACICLLLLL